MVPTAAATGPRRHDRRSPRARFGGSHDYEYSFLAYFDTEGASNGGTEAVNGIIELGRRIARGFRNFEHYRLRMLLITGGLDASPHTQL